MQPPTKSRQSEYESRVHRRAFLIGGAGVGTSLLAGCTGASDAISDDTGDDSADTSGDDSTGRFRLLVSDQPSAIGDFAELNVTFETARVFRAGGDDVSDDIDDNGGNETADNTTVTDDDLNTTDSDNGTNGNESNSSPNNTSDADDVDAILDDADDGGDQGGFTEIDIAGQSADLTELIGDKATEIADVELETGSYSHIQLFVESVEGLASDDYDPDGGPGRPDDAGSGRPNDDDDVETEDSDSEDDDTAADDSEEDRIELPVKLPSERLQIQHPFEISTEEDLEFVFDINVIRRGNDEYILQPVIGESGVVGRDVEADVIDDSDGTDESDDEADSPGGDDDTAADA